MNKVEKTAISAFTGTTLMTAASALMSLAGQDFREPEPFNYNGGKISTFCIQAG